MSYTPYRVITTTNALIDGVHHPIAPVGRLPRHAPPPRPARPALSDEQMAVVDEIVGELRHVIRPGLGIDAHSISEAIAIAVTIAVQRHSSGPLL